MNEDQRGNIVEKRVGYLRSDVWVCPISLVSTGQQMKLVDAPIPKTGCDAIAYSLLIGRELRAGGSTVADDVISLY